MTTASAKSGTPLLRRLGGVARTYHRPAVWLLLAATLLTWGGAVAMRFSTDMYRSITPNVRPSVEWVRLSRQSSGRATVPTERVDWPGLRAVYVNGAVPSTLPQELLQSTELESLHLSLAGWGGRSLSGDQLRGDLRIDPTRATQVLISTNQLEPHELDHLTTERLSYLELELCSLAPDTLRTFGQRFPIRTLVIDDFVLKERADELDSFQQLETLQLVGTPLSRRLIEVLLKLPRLHTFVVKSDPDREKLSRQATGPFDAESQTAPSTTAADLALLQAHPTLKWVYADWSALGLTDIQARELLQPVRALPEQGLVRLTSQVNVTLFGMLLLVMLIVIQLGTLFATPTPQLLPRGWPSHLVWAGLLLAMGTIVAVAAIVQRDARCWPLTAIVLFVPAAIAGGYVLLSRVVRTRQNPGSYLGLVFMLVGFPPQLLWQYCEGECRWFLLGEQPGWAAAIITSELPLIALGLLQVRELYRSMSERGTTHPLLLSARDQQQWGAYPERWTSQTTAVGCQHQGQGRRRAALWRCSLMPTPWKQALEITLYGLVMLVGTQLWITARGSSSTAIWQLLPAVLLFLFAGMTGIFALTAWSVRRLLLADELLRPARREEFVRDLFRACLTSLGPVVLALPGVLILIRGESWSAGEVAGCFSWIAGVLAIAVACGLWMFALRATMLNRIITSLPLFLTPVLLMVSIAMARHMGRNDTTTLLGWLGLAGAGLLAASVVVGLAAYRRSVQREWGLD